jgi:acetyl-CoA acetyltransferase
LILLTDSPRTTRIVLRECCVRAGIDPSEVDDVVCGSVLQPGGGAMYVLLANLSYSTC